MASWIVDDTGFVKKGKHSVGVARQYRGQMGKQENWRVAVKLSVTTEQTGLPIAWHWYLPESWAGDGKRRKATGVREEPHFQTKREIALAQIRRAVEQELPTAPVLADSAWDNDTGFREGITKLGLQYVVGIHENTTVWRPGEVPGPKPRQKGRGRPPSRLHWDAEQLTVSEKAIGSVPASAGVAIGHLAGGNPTRTAIAFCDRSGAPGSPGSEAE